MKQYKIQDRSQKKFPFLCTFKYSFSAHDYLLKNQYFRKNVVKQKPLHHHSANYF